MRRQLAWGLCGLTAVCAAGQTVLLADRPLLSAAAFLEGWPLLPAGTVVGTLVGALVVSRHPGHRVGWLLCAGQATTALGLFAASAGARAGPGHPATWLGAVLGATMGLALIAALLLLAPDGHLLSRRWRPALAAGGTGLAVHVLATAAVGPAGLDASGQPLRIAPLHQLLITGGTVVVIGSLVAGAVSLVLRLRGAEGERRSQLLWIALPAAVLAAGPLVLLTAELVVAAQPGEGTPGPGVAALLYLPLFVGWAGLPVGAGVAVLRHRLFDIDVVVSRAVVLAVTTAFVAVAYVAVVVLIGGLPGGPAGGPWPSLTATAVAALAFQPLRRRVLRLADRLAYGPRAAPYEALADLTTRLAGAPPPDQLLAVTAAAAGTALAAQRATASLDLDEGPSLEAGWAPGPDPRPPPGRTTVEVRDAGEVLGRITVVLPPGRSLRAADRRLLDDLADQAAPAFRNARLEVGLAASVAAFDRRTTELAHSRRRLVDARTTERILLERAIATDVLPCLAALPGRLAAAGAAWGRGGPAPDLESLITATTDVLERLRELSHGIFPVQLARSGLGPAVRALGAGATPPATVDVDPELEGRRHPQPVESALYLCARQAVQATAGPAAVRLRELDGDLVLEVRGRHVTRAAAEVADRVAAVGGSLELDDGVLRARVPGGQAETPAQQSTSRSGPNSPLGTYAAAPHPSSSTSSSA
ncbi:hypothetical protein [Modestobacter marinus]|uniref:hypothetical protein n=1 Tax=Modestobacter marinus TaxID=477641 RepID=UPI001C954D05|nr:hypothetical protein [Modestobacter marinus]